MSFEELAEEVVVLSSTTDTTADEAKVESSTQNESESHQKSDDFVLIPGDKNEECCKAGSCWFPYSSLNLDFFNKMPMPLELKSLLLWSDPKYTCSIFGSSLVLLLSLASFSLLTVISSLLLLALATTGGYRAYLALIFRLKGTEDKAFQQLLEQKVTLPESKIAEWVDWSEMELNRALNELKHILIWDSVQRSAATFAGLYAVYCVGCVFNTLTLMILALVSAFSLPKVYQVYSSPIDQAIERATFALHDVIKQLMTKVPFLNKQKIL
jgi:hypothetical protein